MEDQEEKDGVNPIYQSATDNQLEKEWVKYAKELQNLSIPSRSP